jgi:hypothetical protein
MKLSFSKENLDSLLPAQQIELISECIRILGYENGVVEIDNSEIKSRDQLLNWQIENGYVFSSKK